LALPGSIFNLRKSVQNIRHGQKDVKYTDVLAASKEIIEKQGLNQSSIDMLLAIAIINKNFVFCDEFALKYPLNRKAHQYQYFRAYLVSAKYSLLQQNVNFREGKTKNTKVPRTFEAFSKELIDWVPRRMFQFDIWNSYSNNEYISRYQSSRISKARPRKGTIFDTLRTIIVIITLIAVVTPSTSALWFPDFTQRVVRQTKHRIAEIRLKYASSFGVLEDKNWAVYYGRNLRQWAWDWTNTSGDFTDEERNSLIAWIEMSLPLMDEHDPSRSHAYAQIARIHYDSGDYLQAIDYFEIALQNSDISTDYRDHWTGLLIDSFLMTDNRDAASKLADQFGGHADYPSINDRFANINYYNRDYEKVLDVLQPIEDMLLPYTLVYLGASQYYLGEYDSAAQTLHKITQFDDYNTSHHLQARADIFIAGCYFEDEDYSSASDYYFSAFSTFVNYLPDWLGSYDVSAQLANFLATIELIDEREPTNAYTDLWYFVYFYVVRDYDNAQRHWDNYMQYLQETNDRYGLSFIRTFIENIDAQNG
jgi:tetratricopeptide (TPR) repeat protein